MDHTANSPRLHTVTRHDMRVHVLTCGAGEVVSADVQAGERSTTLAEGSCKSEDGRELCCVRARVCLGASILYVEGYAP